MRGAPEQFQEGQSGEEIKSFWTACARSGSFGINRECTIRACLTLLLGEFRSAFRDPPCVVSFMTGNRGADEKRELISALPLAALGQGMKVTDVGAVADASIWDGNVQWEN